jgi:tetratricopeptide (TPR) repeat protein
MFEQAVGGDLALRVGTWAAVAAFALACLSAAGAAAQSGQPTDPESTEQELRSLERAGEAGRESRGSLSSGGTVTYQDILANPDDVGLNLDYARGQIEDGNLKGASATLQRILLLQPAAAEVRALYGIVLYRLGDLTGAETELARALDQGLSGAAAQQARSYLERTRTAQQTTTGEVTVTLGAAYDSNRNAAPDSGTRLFRDIPVSAPDKQDDIAAVAVLQGSVRHDLGMQRKHALVGNATLYGQEQRTANDYDLQVVSGDGGVSLDLGRLTVVPALRGSFFRLDGESYLAAGGAQLDATYRLRPDLRVGLESFVQYESFSDIDAAQSASERSGTRASARAFAGWNTADVGIEVGFDVTRKQAREDYEAYTAFGPDLEATLLLGGGQFVLGEFDYEIRVYDNNDPFVSADVREENNVRIGLTYGIPLGTLFGDGVPEPLAPVNLLLSTSTSVTESNLLNYDYTNSRAQVLLSRRFRF